MNSSPPDVKALGFRPRAVELGRMVIRILRAIRGC